ncbi:hypothetical protein HHS34_009250 [Acidithiobacillus montserratensis]|uniref:Uncharacterized protein n=1 Tax=Acidithiobacillus montserratensis TaxID=2729135 RepID=A0ACD5HCG4_9PROT|nr:hypothetical protein [Acidithiobacillus montserratensis]MBU2749189.1 hypothetical protein [Acidithiobacillus montserratensis]
MPTLLAHRQDLVVTMRNLHRYRRHRHHREGQRVPVVITSNPVRRHHHPLHELFRKRVRQLKANHFFVYRLGNDTPHLLLKWGVFYIIEGWLSVH